MRVMKRRREKIDGKSIMYSRNRTGPVIDPCRTPYDGYI